ncbi:MAG: VIT domain-containing protein [Kofleriaceae bacterium]
MTNRCDEVQDDLSAIVDGDRAVIARHADHLASCDDCRDARHDAEELGAKLAHAGDDYADSDVLSRVMAKLDQAPRASDRIPVVEAATPPPVIAVKKKRSKLPAVAAVAAIAASGTIYVAATRHHTDTPTTTAKAEPTMAGKLVQVTRAAADKQDGVMVRVAGKTQPLRVNDPLPANAEVITDERTRASFEMADGSRLVLDHGTTLALGAQLKLTSGRIVADIAKGSLSTANATIDLVGAKIEATAAADVTSIQVVRGEALLKSANAHETVRAGEEGLVDHGALTVSPVVNSAARTQWSELTPPPKDGEGLAGIGQLRAYKPGESRDRDWKLALARHDVRVKISGPIARTEITEVFRNDSATQLEGVYQFPLPADAQIDGLTLEVDGKPVEGAFVDKNRAQKIWNGVIDRARPQQIARREEIVWVPGPWRDPAMLDWKRGGKFELRIFPIPANGSRTITISYTQVVTPRGQSREYVYPLPHSSDGSTVADQMSISVEARGATNLRTASYPMTGSGTELTFQQAGFVPRGDLVIDYQPENTGELRAWTFQGGAAVAPDAKLAAKKNVGIDPKVIDAQIKVAGDARPTAVLALQPKLPRWTEDKPRDYAIVLDDSQSMVGERWKHASELATQLIAQMDRRDRFTVLACDSECASLGAPRTPSSSSASQLTSWLSARSIAGASDLVSSVRAGAAALTDNQREKWVIYVGDGFATTGFRKAADVEHALATDKTVHVTTIGLGTDADDHVLQAAARGGGGTFVTWAPGQTSTSTAVAALETTYGASLRDATIELPAGLTDSAPTVLPSIRNGQEVLLSARVANAVQGDVILRGTVAGQPYEQRYPITLAAGSSSANAFVPRLWASLAIDQLERNGRGEDRVQEVALSQAYGVMSRETSLLVLESQAMFDAFGVDRHKPSVTWTGDEAVDEVTASAAGPTPQTGGDANDGYGAAAKADSAKDFASVEASRRAMLERAGAVSHNVATSTPTMPAKKTAAPPTAPQATAPFVEPRWHGRQQMIPMRRVWERVGAIGNYGGVAPELTKEIAASEQALAGAPDSREKHRALVQALSYSGDLAHAKEIALRWQDRDRLDPQVLNYLADFAGRDGDRETSLRTLAGLVDLDPDKAALHERIAAQYERVGRLAQACGHRIALASINLSTMSAGSAARCLRAVGREADARIVIDSMKSDAERAAAEKAAMVPPLAPAVSGDLVIKATWDQGADLDITLVAPDGTRFQNTLVGDATSHEREELAVKTLKRGNYLVEMTRTDGSHSPIRGTVDITVLGVKQSLPFELVGTHVTVGHVDVTLQSHLEEAWDQFMPDDRP